jgi:hypothetical protein
MHSTKCKPASGTCTGTKRSEITQWQKAKHCILPVFCRQQVGPRGDINEKGKRADDTAGSTVHSDFSEKRKIKADDHSLNEAERRTCMLRIIENLTIIRISIRSIFCGLPTVPQFQILVAIPLILHKKIDRTIFSLRTGSWSSSLQRIEGSRYGFVSCYGTAIALPTGAYRYR